MIRLSLLLVRRTLNQGGFPLKIRLNLFFFSCTIITLALTISTLMFLIQMHADAVKWAKTEQEQAIQTFWQFLHAKGDGYRVVNGKLMVGDYVINGNFELPDKVQEIFGGTATIFLGDTRVSTNVLKEDGTRAVGTKLLGPAYDAIFRANRSYRGEAPIFGISYYAAYDPIRDASGNIIGVLYVGSKKGDFLVDYNRREKEIVAGTSLLGILLIAFAWSALRERSRAEAKIRQMADQTRLIADSIPAAIAYIDIDLRYQFANRRYYELFGGEFVDLVGKSVKEVLGEALSAEREENIRQVLAGNKVVFTGQIAPQDGDIIHLQTAFIPHLTINGEVLGFFIQHYDITDLTLTQEALRTSGEHYLTLFNTTGTATLVSEEDTTMSLVNEELVSLTGYSREELEGQLSWTIFVAPESLERMLGYHRARRADTAAVPRVYECDVIRRDGTLRHILVHVNIIPGTNRSIISLLDISDQKQLQASLQSQLTFLQTLIDTIPSPIFYKDRAGRYLGYNLAFQLMLGLKRDQAIGKTTHDIARPELADNYSAMDDALFSNPGTQVYESSIIDANDRRLDVIFYKGTFIGEDGLVAGLVGVILDVTGHKQSERLLAGEKLVMKMIVSDAPLPEVLAAICVNIEEQTSGGLCSLLLLDDDGRHLRHAAAPSLPEAYNRAIDGTRIGPLIGSCGTAAYSGQQVIVSDIATDPRWAKYRKLPLSFGLQACWSQPIKASSGKILGTFAIYYSLPRSPNSEELLLVERAAHLASIVIERKRAAESLRESEDRFHRIFSQNDDAVVLFRMDDLVLIDVNPAALALFEYDRSELLGLKAYMLIANKDFEALVDAIPRDNPTEAFQLDQAYGIRKDGKQIMIVIRCKVLMLREEYVVHCSIRDITEKMRLEDEVRGTQAKLIHTNKMTSIGMLASSVAHEINNPNNCISVNAAMLDDVWQDAVPLLETIHATQGEFMLRGIPFTKMREFAPRLLGGIREGSRRITAIVQNMRDYVREDKSGSDGSVDVNQLLQNAMSILWHHIHLHTDHFNTELGEELPLARGNGQQVEQVLINLLTNALQSLPDKKAGVNIATFVESGGDITVKVRDEGKGMDNATLARLTEPFFTTRTDEGGTGLGLYISASIIKEHGGTLEFKSEPGKGTTATVRLPVSGKSSICAADSRA